jgi:hypothetical protein
MKALVPGGSDDIAIVADGCIVLVVVSSYVTELTRYFLETVRPHQPFLRGELRMNSDLPFRLTLFGSPRITGADGISLAGRATQSNRILTDLMLRGRSSAMD